MNKKDYDFYLKYCKWCKSYFNCPWIDISNDTCQGDCYKKGKPQSYRKKHTMEIKGD